MKYPVFTLLLVSLTLYCAVSSQLTSQECFGISVVALKCYICISIYQANCASPFDNRTFSMHVCPSESNSCAVSKYEMSDGSTMYYRICSKTEKVGCILGRANGQYDSLTCFCNSDGCNQNDI